MCFFVQRHLGRATLYHCELQERATSYLGRHMHYDLTTYGRSVSMTVRAIEISLDVTL